MNCNANKKASRSIKMFLTPTQKPLWIHRVFPRTITGSPTVVRRGLGIAESARFIPLQLSPQGQPTSPLSRFQTWRHTGPQTLTAPQLRLSFLSVRSHYAFKLRQQDLGTDPKSNFTSFTQEKVPASIVGQQTVRTQASSNIHQNETLGSHLSDQQGERGEEHEVCPFTLEVSRNETSNDLHLGVERSTSPVKKCQSLGLRKQFIQK